MKDGNGRPLFKVYKEGKEIRLPNGQLVTDGIKLSAKNDVDKAEKAGDNVLRAIDKANDDMSFPEFRELLLAQENHLMGAALQVYDKRVQRFGEDSAEVKLAKYALREAYKDATEQRKAYTTPETVSNLARLLQRQNKARKGSYLARDLQRVIDAGRTGLANELMQIPSEYRSMYTKAEKILGIKYSATKHSDKGAFSYGRTKYSYSSSDNSNEGLFHRIKNIRSGKASKDSEKFRYRST